MRHWMSLACLALLSTSSWALPPPPPETRAVDGASAQALVQARLVQPLDQRNQRVSRFSRVPPRMSVHRVRLLADGVLTSAKGRYVRFVIDERASWPPPPSADDGWRVAWTGCAYPASGDIFVELGARLLPAAALLGTTADAVDAALCAAPHPAS